VPRHREPDRWVWRGAGKLGLAVRVALALAALVPGACKPRRATPRDEPMPVPPPLGDAGPRTDAGVLDAPGRWPRLATFPATEPVRVIGLPARPDVPRFDVGGPVIAGDVAVVSSSQFGFAAVDWRRGQLLWTKPAGLHVAPPIARGQTAILIGDCENPPDVPDTLLGCLRVVTASGADQGYAAIHGRRVDAFVTAPGPQEVWLDGDRTVRWRRGEAAVSVDLITGLAKPTVFEPPPIHVVYRTHAWDITRTDERIIAREKGKLAWQTQHAYTAVLGAVYLPELAPMLRVANLGSFAGVPEMNLVDIDATGSLHGQVAFPLPALSLLGTAIDAVGNTAIAVRMDASLPTTSSWATPPTRSWCTSTRCPRCRAPIPSASRSRPMPCWCFTTGIRSQCCPSCRRLLRLPALRRRRRKIRHRKLPRSFAAPLVRRLL